MTVFKRVYFIHISSVLRETLVLLTCQRCISDSCEHCNHRSDKCLLFYVFVIIWITDTVCLSQSFTNDA
ncbi:hypothetical protein DQW25_27175 [Escherichia coli O111:H8]|nr:hypothetical protein EC40522_C0003 [Escherichia coli 4.0522]OTC62414.1 hypothetical protein AW083_28220 [Escherichia coli]RBB45653.1 hypothetical protein DQW51_28220 [Escherichia coli O111:H-]RBB73988.1 hypothetical protein DQW25_27175 [Escherichia coli O111:H8]OTC98934.1 hypothetical protein AW090_27570 [Escherichia coli]